MSLLKMAISSNSNAIKDINAFLSQKQNVSDKELASDWVILAELYKKKLWHQLTLKLETFIKHPALQGNEELVNLYNNFLSTFEKKINPLSLVEILAHVVKQVKDKRSVINFLEKVEVKVKSNQEAVALCKVLAGQILLDELNAQNEVNKIIEDVQNIFDTIDGVSTVHSRFYLLESRLYRLEGKHTEYYRSVLRYLGCIELNTLSKNMQEEHAFFLGLAALLGEGIYNIGELLAHPVLESLKGTSNSWLIDLLHAVNNGNIAAFENLKTKWSKVGDLLAQEIKLRQKLSLLCLMEMTSKRQTNNRQLTFAEIAQETRLPIGDVELLVMKALAQSLVHGVIDQVAGIVKVTWVQPRVLDRTQISGMVHRLKDWCKDINSMESLLETRAVEIITL